MKILFPNYFKKAFNFNFLNHKTSKSFSDNVVNNLNNNSVSRSGYFFTYGVTSLPHTDKRSKGGEDSNCHNDNLIAVADGVGGWNEIGVDPSAYSRELCSNILSEYNSNPKNKTEEIFINACQKTKNRGTSTCCICRIKDNNTLDGLNLGDSGYLILRPSFEKDNLQFKIFFKSEEQTHGFNFPFQVGENGDNPASAVLKQHEIQPYDIVILATDGLWDNVSNESIIKLIKSYLDKNKAEFAGHDFSSLVIPNIQSLTNYITSSAEFLSLETDYKSPFAIRSGGLYIGGKHDDITIIIAQIMDKSAKF